MTIRFLHAADLHLDTPFKGLAHVPEALFTSIRNSTFHAYTALVDYAVQEKPDFIVIVGDIYDGEDRSLRAQLKFQEGLRILEAAQIPVFITYGNHDHLQGRWTRFDLPDNVTVFSEEIEQKTMVIRGEKVTITGFSYPARHVIEEKINDYPVSTGDHVHIGLLHGSIKGDESHAIYAPFTKEALLSKQYDYWALGHIHKRQVLHKNPPIVYPGNLQGRHRNEGGDKGFYDVTIQKARVNPQFISAATVIFEEIDICCKGIRHVGDWLETCEKVMIDYQRRYDRPLMLALKMTHIEAETAALFHQSPAEEWLEIIQDKMQGKTPFIWVYQIDFAAVVTAEGERHALYDPVIQTMQQWSTERWEEVLQDLYQHPRMIQYVDRLKEADYEGLMEEGKQLLKHALEDEEVRNF